jgi:hypothetical protein
MRWIPVACPTYLPSWGIDVRSAYITGLMRCGVHLVEAEKRHGRREQETEKARQVRDAFADEPTENHSERLESHMDVTISRADAPRRTRKARGRAVQRQRGSRSVCAYQTVSPG